MSPEQPMKIVTLDTVLRGVVLLDTATHRGRCERTL